MSKPEVENNNKTEDENVAEESVFSTKISTMASQMEELLKTVKTMTNDLKTVKKEYLKLEKKASALEKSKGRKKKNREEGVDRVKRQGGFNKPIKVSEELSKFLNLEEGRLVARPEVTTLMSNYIKEHNLQKIDDGRKIDMTNPGGEILAKLLGTSVDTEMDYFKMQKYLTSHYISTKEEVKEEVKGEVKEEVKGEVKEEVKEEEVKKAEKVEKVEKAETEDVKPRRRRHVAEVAV